MKIKINKGITLVSLIITIVVLLLLAGVVISISLNYDKITNKAKEATFKMELSKIKENYDNYISFASNSNIVFEISLFNWDGIENPIGTAKLFNAPNEDEIKHILGDIPTIFNNRLAIQEGELYVKNCSEEEILWASSYGINNINIGSEETMPILGIMEYQEQTEEIAKLKISIDNEGFVNVDGQSGAYCYYVKLNGGLEILRKTSNSSNTIATWCTNLSTFASKGQCISQEVEIISGSFDAREFNYCIRGKDKNSIFITKMHDNNYNNTIISPTDLSCTYLYISENAVFRNLKIKVNCYEKEQEVVNDRIPLIPCTMTYKTLTCTINSNNEIIFNTSGQTASNYYIKLSNGFEVFENPANINWSTEPKFLDNSKKVRLSIAKTGTTTGTAFDCVLRDTEDNNVLMCKLIDGINSAEATLTNDVSVFYLFIRKGATFDNYKIIPTLEILE